MPQELISVPFCRFNAGTAGALNSAYPETTFAASGTTGQYLGPFSLPSWVDVSRPIRAYIRPRGANPAIPGQAIVFNLLTQRLLADGSRSNFTNPFTYAPAALWAGTSPRVEFVDDVNYLDPLFPAHTFAPFDSIGFQMTRDGNAAGDSYTFTVNVGSYLELLAYVRCQKICC